MKQILPALLLFCAIIIPASANTYSDSEVLYGKKQYERAIPLFQKAGNKGDRDAQARLGSMYAEGQGTKPDLPKAIYWYTKAAEQGHQASQTNLGVLHEKNKNTQNLFIGTVKLQNKVVL